MSGVAGTGPAAPVGADGGVGAAPAGVEARIARLLTWGTRLAIALLAIGCALLVAEGRSPLDAGWPPLDLAALPSNLLALRAEGFLWLGLIATIGTPLLRVGAATLGFARVGDRRLTALGIGVLVIIGLAVVAGTVGS